MVFAVTNLTSHVDVFRYTIAINFLFIAIKLFFYHKQIQYATELSHKLFAFTETMKIENTIRIVTLKCT